MTEMICRSGKSVCALNDGSLTIVENKWSEGLGGVVVSERK